MPVSQLFEVTIDAAGVSTSNRVSRLSQKNRRRLSASGGVMALLAALLRFLKLIYELSHLFGLPPPPCGIL